MKIQIIGASGTGKSTLGQYIAEKELVKWIDTDCYIWQDDTFTKAHAIPERLKRYQNDRKLFKDFIASGSVFGWNPEGFMDRDLLVFLFLDEDLRMERLKKREVERGGDSALILDENGEQTNEFIEWCKTYYTAQNPSDIGTYAEHRYQIEHSVSPVLKLNSDNSLETLHHLIIDAFHKQYKRRS
ncbi:MULTISPECIES: AAA family ATPase [unclassified Enterococcus]|uniref:AAA family ATPase n=1 Tax=unclassified Enterococcus TaxID=2608891 RepID=UPI001CE0B065|nr:MULTISPECIES: AAA family ATPase [unclassified Enterococcus]MCA5011444.1 AAA family ATPase [Enterococcus sp. S23]MCA5015114.1 AAA family ATPase [Enterococcus sp. S22(2020)]